MLSLLLGAAQTAVSDKTQTPGPGQYNFPSRHTKPSQTLPGVITVKVWTPPLEGRLGGARRPASADGCVGGSRGGEEAKAGATAPRRWEGAAQVPSPGPRPPPQREQEVPHLCQPPLHHPCLILTLSRKGGPTFSTVVLSRHSGTWGAEGPLPVPRATSHSTEEEMFPGPLSPGSINLGAGGRGWRGRSSPQPRESRPESWVGN